MQWLIIFLLVLASVGLNACSLIPKTLPNQLPSVNAHLGKTETKVAVKRDENQIEHPMYNYNQIKDLTWRENFLYCVLLIIAFSTEPIVPSLRKFVKNKLKKRR